MMDINKLKEAADCLVTDLNMLMDGSWEPDADSCQASIDMAVLIANNLPLLMDVIEAQAYVLTKFLPAPVDQPTTEAIEAMASALNKLGPR